MMRDFYTVSVSSERDGIPIAYQFRDFDYVPRDGLFKIIVNLHHLLRFFRFRTFSVAQPNQYLLRSALSNTR